MGAHTPSYVQLCVCVCDAYMCECVGMGGQREKEGIVSEAASFSFVYPLENVEKMANQAFTLARTRTHSHARTLAVRHTCTEAQAHA